MKKRLFFYSAKNFNAFTATLRVLRIICHLRALLHFLNLDIEGAIFEKELTLEFEFFHQFLHRKLKRKLAELK